MKVSVFCMVYNHEQFIRSALDGFVNQKTDFDYEVFVHDDASTDNSRAIIQEYADRYPEIIKPVFQTENQYSKGVLILEEYVRPVATGEYIAKCEGDDYWTDPMKLQMQVDFLDAHPEYSACVHNTMAKNVSDGSEYVMFSHTKDEDITFDDVIERGGGAYHLSSIMYRAECEENKPSFYYAAKGYNDYPFAIQLALCGKIRFINKTMSVYRVGNVRSWSGRNLQQAQKRIEHYKNIIEMLREVDRCTNGEKSEIINRTITTHEYRILSAEENYARMRKPPYDALYRQEPLSARVKMRIKEHAGWLTKVYRKLKHSS